MAWIACTKRLPVKGRIVLVTNGKQVGIGFQGFGSGKMRVTLDNVFWMRPVTLDPLLGITHWQNLPRPPRKRKVK